MSESRDRLSRSDDTIISSGRQRQAGHGLVIFSDQAGGNFGTPFRWGSMPLNGVSHQPLGTAATRGHSGGVRRGNVPSGGFRRGRGQGGGSALPSWYPRAPLRDITAITWAIERRRALSLREPEEGLQTASPVTHQDQVPDEPLLSAQLEHFSVNHGTAEEAEDYLTPQQPRKLVNDIDSVEKAVLEEIKTLKSTPSAKKAERARKVRTLMSMR